MGSTAQSVVQQASYASQGTTVPLVLRHTVRTHAHPVLIVMMSRACGMQNNVAIAHSGITVHQAVCSPQHVQLEPTTQMLAHIHRIIVSAVMRAGLVLFARRTT